MNLIKKQKKIFLLVLSFFFINSIKTTNIKSPPLSSNNKILSTEISSSQTSFQHQSHIKKYDQNRKKQSWYQFIYHLITSGNFDYFYLCFGIISLFFFFSIIEELKAENVFIEPFCTYDQNNTFNFLLYLKNNIVAKSKNGFSFLKKKIKNNKKIKTFKEEVIKKKEWLKKSFKKEKKKIEKENKEKTEPNSLRVNERTYTIFDQIYNKFSLSKRRFLQNELETWRFSLTCEKKDEKKKVKKQINNNEDNIKTFSFTTMIPVDTCDFEEHFYSFLFLNKCIVKKIENLYDINFLGKIFTNIDDIEIITSTLNIFEELILAIKNFLDILRNDLSDKFKQQEIYQMNLNYKNKKTKVINVAIDGPNNMHKFLCSLHKLVKRNNSSYEEIKKIKPENFKKVENNNMINNDDNVKINDIKKKLIIQSNFVIIETIIKKYKSFFSRYFAFVFKDTMTKKIFLKSNSSSFELLKKMIHSFNYYYLLTTNFSSVKSLIENMINVNSNRKNNITLSKITTKNIEKENLEINTLLNSFYKECKENANKNYDLSITIPEYYLYSYNKDEKSKDFFFINKSDYDFILKMQKKIKKFVEKNFYFAISSNDLKVKKSGLLTNDSINLIINSKNNLNINEELAKNEIEKEKKKNNGKIKIFWQEKRAKLLKTLKTFYYRPSLINNSLSVNKNKKYEFDQSDNCICSNNFLMILPICQRRECRHELKIIFKANNNDIKNNKNDQLYIYIRYIRYLVLINLLLTYLTHSWQRLYNTIFALTNYHHNVYCHHWSFFVLKQYQSYYFCYENDKDNRNHFYHIPLLDFPSSLFLIIQIINWFFLFSYLPLYSIRSIFLSKMFLTMLLILFILVPIIKHFFGYNDYYLPNESHLLIDVYRFKAYFKNLFWQFLRMISFQKFSFKNFFAWQYISSLIKLFFIILMISITINDFNFFVMIPKLFLNVFKLSNNEQKQKHQNKNNLPKHNK